MLHEVELLVRSEDVLVEVLGRIRGQDETIVLPPIHRGAGAATMAEAVARHLRSEARLLERLGAPPATATDVAGVAQAVVAAAARVVEEGGSIRGLLVQATLERSLLAHYVAAHLGSTACPLTEELARPLWELTAPDAEDWRERGWFRAPMPLPDHVSWRDRFLLSAGHEPHPLGH